MSFRLGVTLYSFSNEYCSFRWSLEDCMQKASELGKGQGLEIVGPQAHRYFPHVSDEFERQFKSAIERYQLTPTSYGSYADPGMIPGRNLTEDELVEYTIPQIKGAAKLGLPIVRLQYFVDPVVERLLPYAEKCRVKMGYELHVPLALESAETQGLIKHVSKISSEHLGLIPDGGLFCRTIPKMFLDEGVRNGVPQGILDRVQALWQEKASEEAAHSEIEKLGGDQISDILVARCWALFGQSDPALLSEIMPYIIHAHGKFFHMEDGAEATVRYEEFVKALVKGGYRGFMSSEFEGHQFSDTVSSFDQVKAQQALVKRYIAKYTHGSKVD
jgi:sugar phosphate isomerase/epimerase